MKNSPSCQAKNLIRREIHVFLVNQKFITVFTRAYQARSTQHAILHDEGFQPLFKQEA
jgi:hypothetical protein